MKVDRSCPRCRSHAYHWANTPKTDDPELVDVPLDRWPPTKIPYRVWITCASCAHSWNGQLNKVERGIVAA